MYELKLSAVHLTYIGEALGDRPYKEVVAIINAIQAQVTEQELKAAAPPAPLEPLLTP